MNAGSATRLSPLLERGTTLRDALSLLLDAAVRSGIVVDDAGRPVGLVTINSITDLLHEQDGEPGPPSAGRDG